MSNSLEKIFGNYEFPKNSEPHPLMNFMIRGKNLIVRRYLVGTYLYWSYSYMYGVKLFL